jgi:hypothetical protein
MVHFVKFLEPNGRVRDLWPGDPSVRIDLTGGQMQVVKGPLADVVEAIERKEKVS